MNKYNVCVYSGSFNPIHNGHIALAEYLVDRQIVDEVWVIITPQNPLKPSDTLINDNLRLQMARLALEGRKGIVVSDVEIHLPKPSYTIDTLRFLQSQYPLYGFCLLIGQDNVAIFDKWKSYRQILHDFRVLVYPRNVATTTEHLKYPEMQLLTDAPTVDISSTDIRSRVKSGLPITGLLPDAVAEFIAEHRLYKN
ncbi:nicotinate-nucleotide adenylyltransferase [Bacteroidetes oral taxon 274 str. F0058]|nr:nicotinate-nucleotide adenylyltransferase [Bacteroidetes oral taxon 274 str. F0058]